MNTASLKRPLDGELIDRWEKEFEIDPGIREKLYINVAFPYPSGAMHVGHGRTYTVPDVIARFWRMKGKQVLFPMGFHVTGTPVIGISKRIAKGDEKTIHLYRDLYRVSQEELNQFIDPMVIVRHFSQEYERVMRNLGLSIDWRRRFITVDPHYSKFIEWQYKHLGSLGYVSKGIHPVKYCPQCENPVGDHDLLEGDKAEILKFTLVMFSSKGAFIPTATLRPETTYGVTNIWVNPTITYLRANVDGVQWIISKEAGEKLRIQDHKVEIIEELPIGSLVGEHASHPLCGEVPILPAEFVDPEVGSGIVMSVPAHAPFDYIALRDLQRQGKYLDIKPISLLTVEGYGEFPAKDAVERAGIESQHDSRMDSITQEIYSTELIHGRMLNRYGGKSVRQTRDEIATKMVEQYHSMYMYDFDVRPVVCRCGGKVFVKILKDQWFLQYSNPFWKDLVYSQLNKVELIPNETRAEFERTIGWLKDWACTRRVGLGTKLPWDKAWIIEPLSDSTIYMAYYTIAHRITAIAPEKLTPDVFDYIFLGKEFPNLPERPLLDAMREEFLYWYPYDFRFSAKDLISNHLTFQLFHHIAIFPREFQPKGVVVFGMGLLNGAKMSSSKGNVVLLEDAIKELGADTVRMFLVGSAEPWQDFDWRNELVQATKRQIERFWNTIIDITSGTLSEIDSTMDKWLLSRLQSKISRTTEAIESFQTRQAFQEAFHSIESDLRWYRRRTGNIDGSSSALKELAHVWVRLLAPYTPFTCERLWTRMGEKGLICSSPWPARDESMITPDIELAEELIMRTVEDIESIQKLIKITPTSITLYCAPQWKWHIFKIISQSKEKEKVIGEIMRDPEMRMRGKEVVDASKQIISLIHKFPPDLIDQLKNNTINEIDIFLHAKKFLEHEFEVPVHVLTAEGSNHTKARLALPFKPAIVIG